MPSPYIQHGGESIYINDDGKLRAISALAERGVEYWSMIFKTVVNQIS